MEDFLKHYGVKGMKWGVVKKAANDGSEHAKWLAKETQKNKEAKTMTNDELKKRIERLNLEKKYSELNPSKFSKGSEYVSRALAVVGSVASAIASVYIIRAAIKKASGTP